MKMQHRFRLSVLLFLMLLTACAAGVTDTWSCRPAIPLNTADRAALRERFGVRDAQICTYTAQTLEAALQVARQSRAEMESAEMAEQRREAAQEDAREPDAPDQVWMRTRLQDENGNIPAEGLAVAQQQIGRMRAVQGRTAALGRGLWQSFGPSNIGGRIRSLIIHPTTPSIMYAGGVRGGIWKTTNGGARWSALDDFLPNLSVTALVFDPQNPNTIWAGTGEYLIGGGIYQSTDAGATWTSVPGTAVSAFQSIRRLAISVHSGVTRLTVAATVVSIRPSTVVRIGLPGYRRLWGQLCITCGMSSKTHLLR